MLVEEKVTGMIDQAMVYVLVEEKVTAMIDWVMVDVLVKDWRKVTGMTYQVTI